MAATSVDKVDANDIPLNVATCVASFLFCLVVHHYLSRRVCRRGFESYARLTWQLQMEWDSRIVSTVHAALVTILSLYSLVTEQPLWTGKIDGPTRLGGVTVSISAGYMLADTISMPIYWRDINLLVFWLHHAIAAACFYICASGGVLHFFALFRLLSEMSTPFLNVNWYTRLCNVSSTSLLSLGNAACLSASYLAFRLLAIPLYWYYLLQSVRTAAFQRLASEAGLVTCVWIGSSLVLDVLNIFWARTILLGSLQAVRAGLQLRLPAVGRG